MIGQLPFRVVLGFIIRTHQRTGLQAICPAPCSPPSKPCDVNTIVSGIPLDRILKLDDMAVNPLKGPG